jgi:hypothetical protein
MKKKISASLKIFQIKESSVFVGYLLKTFKMQQLPVNLQEKSMNDWWSFANQTSTVLQNCWMGLKTSPAVQ